MNAVPFDTLKLARDFEVAGMAPPVAAGTAAALADALIGADLVTKSDLDTRLGSFEARLNAIFEAFEAKFDAKLEILRRDMTIKLGGMLVIAVGVILAAMRFMPHP
jgi:hypothetical protein